MYSIHCGINISVAGIAQFPVSCPTGEEIPLGYLSRWLLLSRDWNVGNLRAEAGRGKARREVTAKRRGFATFYLRNIIFHPILRSEPQCSEDG